MATINLHAAYRVRDKDVAAKRFDDETIVINLSTGLYYALTGTGSVAWGGLAGGVAPAGIAQALATAYDRAADDVRDDMTGFVAMLLEEELIERTAENGAETIDLPTVGDDRPAAYSPPTLERYSDMADLLGLDPPMPFPDGADAEAGK